MTDPQGHPRGLLSWLRSILRKSRRRPHRPKDRELDRETLRAQIQVIRRAFDGNVGVAIREGDDDADAEFLHRPEHVLVRNEHRGEIDEFFDSRQDTYDGRGEFVDQPIDGVWLYRLPPRRSTEGGDGFLTTLDEINRVRRGMANPDHLLYVVGSIGKACPATEPESPPGTSPVPAVSKNPGAGKGVRVSVVDTGWYPDAATDSDSPWLAQGVEGDVEQVNASHIHEYAGHGTFVAGVIRCMAPATEIEVEGFLINGGAIYESEIARQLNEALLDRDHPQLISISAGTHTYNSQPLVAFEMLAIAHKLAEGDSSLLVVAAAGNDGNDVPFYPAAFDWVLSVGSLDADGQMSKFSNYGSWVDVYAQGRDLVNAYPTGTYTYIEPASGALFGTSASFTGLARWSGTSFSTPVVTGAIAAYMSEHGVTARQARDALIAAAPTKPDPNVGTLKALGPPFM